MKKGMSKVIAGLLSAIMIVNLFLNFEIPLSATTSGITQDQAAAWIKARGDESWCEDVDGANGCQCVDLVMKYYDYLLSYHLVSCAYEYVSNSLPSGWSRSSTPQKGDICVWGSSASMGGYYAAPANGHVGLVYAVSGSTVYTVETNVNYNSYACFFTRDASYVTTFIHPDFVTHTHSYTSTVTTEPSCTTTGVRTYTCTCGDSYTEVIPVTEHTWDDGVVVTDVGCSSDGTIKYTCTKCSAEKTVTVSATGHTVVTDNAVAPTCTETGLTEGSHCADCGAIITEQETIPALGHEYHLTSFETNCESVTGTYNCTRCDDEKTENSNVSITSDWSEEEPENILPENIESKQQYKKSDKITVTSDTELGEGYTFVKKEITSWSDWSDYQTTPVTESENVIVETRYIQPVTHTEYNYSKYTSNSNCTGWTGPSLGYWSDYYCQYYFERGWGSQLAVIDSSQGFNIYSGAWYNETTRTVTDKEGYTEYRYKTGTYTYTYTYWSDYSDWQDEAITANDNTNVETRTLYRYTVYPSGHSYKSTWDYNEIIHWHTCEDCFSISDEANHVYDNDNDTTCNVCGYERKINYTVIFKNYDNTVLSSNTYHYGDSVTEPATPTRPDDSTYSYTFAGWDKTVTTCTGDATYTATYTPTELKTVDDDDPQIVVETKKAFAGKTVNITVSLKNNPGIWGMDVKVNYDKTKLTLNSVTNGTVFADGEWTKGNLAGEKYILSYEASGFENVTGDGVLATLEFTVNDEAAKDDFYQVSVSYNAGDIIDIGFNEPDIATVSGGVKVIDFIYGDLNGDGLVNKKDSLLMKMYLADNSTVINSDAADVYTDGLVNKKDSLYLKQYLAGLDVVLGK